MFHLEGSHNTDAYLKLLRDVTSISGLRGKVAAIVHDNAKSVQSGARAFCALQQDLPDGQKPRTVNCMLHSVNLGLKHSVDESGLAPHVADAKSGVRSINSSTILREKLDSALLVTGEESGALLNTSTTRFAGHPKLIKSVLRQVRAYNIVQTDRGRQGVVLGPEAVAALTAASDVYDSSLKVRLVLVG